MTHESLANFRRAVEADDTEQVSQILRNEKDWSSKKDECPSLVRLLSMVRSTAMADVLLENGLTSAMITDEWSSGFGLNEVSPLIAEHFIQRGATLSPHAAAALGLVERLGGILDGDPDLVRAKGGDGARPLHFSRNVACAKLLLERGAELDPKDDDHDSTPAQWRIGDVPEVTRFLLSRGAKPDIFMAAGLGDLQLAERLVSADPECVTWRIGNNSGPYPGLGYKGRGGTIYQWSLGFNQSPHEIAHHRSHHGLFDFLMRHTPPRPRFLVACMLADRSMAREILVQSPGVLDELNDEDRALLAKSCWETNLNADAVRLMIDLGFPVDVPEFNHGYLPLHNAAWCGNAELVELLLAHGAPVDRRDPNFNATALGFALHSCLVARRHPEGDFPRVVELLLEAGVPLDDKHYPTEDPAIDAVIKRRINR